MRFTWTPLQLLLDQQLGEPLSDLVVLDDVGLQVDVVLGVLDGFEHGSVGRRAIHQQLHAVAHHQRAADDLRLQGQVSLEDAGSIAILLESFDDPPAPFRAEGSMGSLELDGTRDPQRHVRHQERKGPAACLQGERECRHHEQREAGVNVLRPRPHPSTTSNGHSMHDPCHPRGAPCEGDPEGVCRRPGALVWGAVQARMRTS